MRRFLRVVLLLVPFVLAYHNERALTGVPAAPAPFGYVWTQYGGPPQVSYNSAGAPNTVDYATVDFACTSPPKWPHHPFYFVTANAAG